MMMYLEFKIIDLQQGLKRFSIQTVIYQLQQDCKSFVYK